MHTKFIAAKIIEALADFEGRVNARLDAIEAKLDRFFGQSAPSSPAEAEDATPKPRKVPR